MKKIFRKIHLWLSVPFGIFITLICFSGAMMVFEKEITEWCRPDLYFVKEVKARPLPLDSLMERVAATLPDSVTVTGVTISPDPERTYQVSLSKPRRASLYMNQYTGEVTGRSERLPFFDTMFHLHRWLMGDAQSKDGGMSTGKLLVGISTLVLVIVLITGILMWLTNRRKPLKKSLTISFTKGWPHFWHDLHVAGGIYATIFLLALALTGLTWSFAWYRTGFYGMFGVEASAGGHGNSHGGSKEGVQGREGRGHHGEGRSGRQHNRGGAHEEADSLKGKEVEGRRHGRHHDFVEGRQHGHPAQEAALAAAPQMEQATEHAKRNESKQDKQAAPNETTVQQQEEAATEHRGRHGRGGRDRYHHAGDSTGSYAHRHRRDSLAEHPAEEPAVIATVGDSTRSHRANHAYVADKRNGKRGNGGKEGRKNRPAAALQESRQAEVATVRPDSLAMPAEAPRLSPFAHWPQVYEQLAKATPGYRQISLSDGSASVVPAGRNSLRAADRYDFDPANGKITGSKPYAEQEKAAKVRGAIYTLHVGSWGGILTRIITFLAALLGATLPLTGYYLWIRRLINKSAHKQQKPKA